MKFRTTVELGGKTATGLRVPPEVVESLGSSKRPSVRVTINGHTYRGSIASLGGAYTVALSAENREAAGVHAGDEVELEQAKTAETRDRRIAKAISMLREGRS